MDYTTQSRIDEHLKELFGEIGQASRDLQLAEREYADAKAAYEVESAGARMQLRQWALDSDRKLTQSEIEDRALLRCKDAYTRLNTAEASQKALRHNVRRIEVQIDITRSLGAGQRAAMQL